MPAGVGNRVCQAYHRFDGEAKLLLVTLGIIFAAGAVIAHYLGAGSVGVGLLFGGSGLSVVAALALISIKCSPPVPRRQVRVDPRPGKSSVELPHLGITDPEESGVLAHSGITDPEESGVLAHSEEIDPVEAAEHVEKKRKPLLVYAFQGNLLGVKTCIDMCRDVNMRDTDRNTSLHLAVMNGCEEIVIFLKNVKGIDLQARNRDGKTSHDLARLRAQHPKTSDPKRAAYIQIRDMLPPPTSSIGEKEE